MIRIAGLTRFSSVDFQGVLAAVLYTPGCNYDCFYCHNRPLLQHKTPVLPTSDVLAWLDKRRGQLEGVVISGGEPSLQPDLEPFVRAIKDMGYLVKLDTNGSRPKQLAALLQARLLDRVAVDYKAPWHRYKEICRCGPGDIQAVQTSLQLLGQHPVAWEARTTVVPQLTLSDLLLMAAAVPALPAWFLQPYRQPPVFRPEDRILCETPPYTEDTLRRMQLALVQVQPSVKLRV